MKLDKNGVSVWKSVYPDSHQYRVGIFNRLFLLVVEQKRAIRRWKTRRTIHFDGRWRYLESLPFTGRIR